MTYIVGKLKTINRMENQPSINNRNEDFSLSVQIPNDLSKIDLDDLMLFFKQKFVAIINNKIDRDLNSEIDPDLWLELKVASQIDSNSDILHLSNFFQFNSWIKICSNTYDQFLKMPISNFIGRIIDFYNDGENDVFYIEWSSNSLENFSDPNLKKCIKRKVSPFGTFIASDMVLPINYTENIQQLKRNQIKLLEPFFIEKYALEYEAVFKSQLFSTDLYPDQIWANYFENILNIEKEIDLLDQNRTFRLITITGSDEKNGVWVEVELENRRYVHPLNKFTHISSPDFIRKVFNFYHFWSLYFFRTDD